MLVTLHKKQRMHYFLAWLPAQLSLAHKKKLVGKLGLGARIGDKLCPDQELVGPMKLSGRALYDDGQMINSNVINNVTKERFG